MTPEPAGPRTGRLVWIVLWVSASVLGFEISLMRMLLIAGWHHFAFLVISIALIGFGASGTALVLGRRWVLRQPERVLFWLALIAALSMPICAGIAQHIPIEARLAPSQIWRQLGGWAAYWALLAIPFLLGAAAICGALMAAKQRIAGVYGANLLGSAAGAAIAPLCMCLMPPAWLPTAFAGFAWLGALGFAGPRKRSRLTVLLLCPLVIGTYLIIDHPHLRADPYKYSAYLQRLIAQGDAHRAAGRFGPRGVVEAFRSDSLHDLQFLTTGETPPPLTVITIDGHWAGSVLDIESRERAGIVDHMLMGFAYELAADKPRVALLGETGGTNIWLARRREASTIDVVQSHEAVVSLILGPLADAGGAVLQAPEVHAIVAEPRHFIENTTNKYDLIQLVSLESSAAGSGGIGGMGQDYNATVQSFSACLDRLSDLGVLFACRGIQTPPRDNIKLLATLIEALKRTGIEHPEHNIIIVRDYLAVCTIIRPTPFSADEIEHIRSVCLQRELTPVWFDGIRPEELNQPDALPPPPDGIGDWYHHAARALFSSEAAAFIHAWRFDVRPATDDRPFFHDYCRLKSVGALRETFGDLWLTRAEIAFLFVLAASGLIVVFGGLLTVLPLVILRSMRRPGRGVTAVYFAAIGLGYLLLEMTFLSRLTLWIGDAVLAAAVTITGFLVFSGAGSLTAQVLQITRNATLRALIAGLILIGAFEVILLPMGISIVGGLSLWMRCAVSLAAIAPPAYLMGFPMPTGLARIDRGEPALIPWAWGVNGFASVLAAPLATAIGMVWGFAYAGFAAVALYGLAALLVGRLRRGEDAA